MAAANVSDENIVERRPVSRALLASVITATAYDHVEERAWANSYVLKALRLERQERLGADWLLEMTPFAPW